MRSEANHVFLISYNRPRILARTLEALRSQTCRDFRPTLVQDGPRDAGDSAETEAIGQCIDIFRRAFPGGEVLRQEANAGVGLNILRAQQRAFRELGLAAAFFFEDDLVLHRTYLEQLFHLREVLFPFRYYAPYFACYGQLHAFSAHSEHIPGTGLRFMDHSLWAYGLFRDHWLEEQKLLEPYFSYLRAVPYHRRKNGIIEDIFRRLGYPHPISSQDGARIVALQVLKRCAVTTIPRRASYIGEIGEHSFASTYSDWGFATQPLPQEVPIFSPAVDEKMLREACSRFPEWVKTLNNLPPNRISQLKSEIAMKDRRISELAGKASQLAEHVALLRNSSCWRATAPLRFVLDKVRAAKRRLFRRAVVPLRFEPGIVAIDISTLWHHDGGTGIQRVVRKMAVELVSAAREKRRVVLVDYSSGVPLDVTEPFLGSGEASVLPKQITAMEMLIMLDSSYNLAPSFSRRLRKAKRDGVFVVSVCHDLLPVTNPEWFLAVNHFPFRRWLELASDYSNAFLCVSETTASRLRTYLTDKGAASSPAVAAWPLGHDFDTWNRRSTEDSGEDVPFVLMVGTVEPRKNHVFILETLAKLRASGARPPKLVVVGRHGWKSKAARILLREAVQSGWAEWHDHGIPDEELSSLYSRASCVIQASLDEGFGLPVAEGAAMGKPVVLSDIPVFREIVQENGYFFRLGDTQSFGDALASACRPGAKPTTTKAVSWRESADIFWRRCLELQKAEATTAAT